MRYTMTLLLLVTLLATSAATPAPAAAATDCQFTLGFLTIKNLIPDVVGRCLENEHHSALNGDSLQRTSSGLLVWRKADNFTAFTDGYHTWVNGPRGLQSRLNNQRFAWENDLFDLRVSQTGFVQSGATVAFAVMVENLNGSYALENVPLAITAYDAAGRALGTQNATLRVVLPTQKRGVAGRLTVSEGATVARIDGKAAEGRFISARPGASFGVERATYSGGASGKITAEITNYFPRAVTSVYVAAVAYNAAGEIVGAGDAVIGRIPGQGRSGVEIALSSTGTPARITLYPSFTGESKYE